MEKNKVILIILDGFGISPIEEGNAILKAITPCLDALWQNFPKTLLRASGEEVGLPWGEMGNSEVGHLNLGTGRVSEQDLPRINKTITDGSFFNNEYLIDACDHAKKNKSTLHLLGLVSDGGVHSDIEHLLALIDLAKKQGLSKVAIHAITDGRDMPAKSAERVFKKIDDKIVACKIGKIATMIGRFYGMDRDKNWDRVQKAYNLLTLGAGEISESWETALDVKYKAGEDDEKLSPVILDKDMLIKDNDAVIMYNFRQDRAKQLAETLINPDYKNFERKRYAKNVRFISFVSYGNEQTPLVNVAYMAEKMSNQVAMTIANAGLSQLHIAETEKYAHVTYFFNGGEEKAFNKEERIIIPSPKVKSYDQKPEMSAELITSKFLNYFKSNKPDFSVINFANPDMVGHTGNLQAAIKAVEVIDKCLEKIVFQLSTLNSQILITADHGNAEQMINPETHEIDKEHTTNPIPLVIIDKGLNISNLLNNKISYDEKLAFFASQPTGVLADISPTILAYLGLNQPKEMTGTSLKGII
ncbi:MAG: hypothetical protein ACD_58C00121G0001 [uncultured bacterium]|nr:MAG: hypothetical protein ACD_58C00121G0001 [uncultured bacterium]